MPTIWSRLRDCLTRRGVPIDFRLFGTYEDQLDAFVKGDINVAWNDPLAHVRTQRAAGGRSVSVGMRDMDVDFRTVLVAHKDSPVKKLGDIAGRRVLAGTFDSAQAYILPLHFTAEAGVDLSKVHVTRYDRDVGLHGDTAAGERLVLERLVKDDYGAAGFVSRLALEKFPHGKDLAVVHEFPVFDHCQFDASTSLPPAVREAFTNALQAMDFDNDERDREAMKMEGVIKTWMGPRAGDVGYDHLRRATKREKPVTRPPPAHTPAANPFASLEVL